MPEGPLIAVVDDDRSIRNATQDLLNAAGFSTFTFENAKSFLGSSVRASVACLVADMRMPGMTGLELHEHLATSGNGIPTVIITAHPARAVARARTPGGNHLLSHQAVYARRASRVRAQGARQVAGPPHYPKVLAD